MPNRQWRMGVVQCTGAARGWVRCGAESCSARQCNAALVHGSGRFVPPPLPACLPRVILSRVQRRMGGSTRLKTTTPPARPAPSATRATETSEQAVAVCKVCKGACWCFVEGLVLRWRHLALGQPGNALARPQRSSPSVLQLTSWPALPAVPAVPAVQLLCEAQGHPQRRPAQRAAGWQEVKQAGRSRPAPPTHSACSRLSRRRPEAAPAGSTLHILLHGTAAADLLQPVVKFFEGNTADRESTRQQQRGRNRAACASPAPAAAARQR